MAPKARGYLNYVFLLCYSIIYIIIIVLNGTCNMLTLCSNQLYLIVANPDITISTVDGDPEIGDRQVLIQVLI